MAVPEPLLAVHARRNPAADALLAPGERLSWADLHERARAAAGTLAARGVRRGERVAIELPAGTDFAVALHACLLLGAPVLPVDLRLAPPERESRAAQAAHRVSAPLEGSDPLSPPDARGLTPSEVMLAVHTSGTTSAPKLVELTWGNVEANALGSALALGFDRAERWLSPMPLTHVGGLMVLLRSLVYGTAAHLLPAPFDAEQANAAIREATLASLVPTMLARMLDAGLRNPPRLRAVLLGGAPSDPALLERAKAAGVPVAQTYGLTEACSQVCTSAPGEPETAGWPLPGITVELEPDGEILVSGPTVAGGGTLRTGDLGRLDERGRLTVIGRKSDTIVSGGENVAPAEVEAVLLAHPAVADAGVFARPDAEWGEAIAARVVLRPGLAAAPEELKDFCRERLARFKVPKVVELADTLPRTASGKLLRREL
jgi:o-succinylbenzoate---CoA ligase